MTASPTQLVVMLYDGAGRFLRQAEIAADEGAWRHASDRLDKADAILDELLVTLDTSAGQVAERLQGIYVFCKRLLIEARLEQDVERIRRTAALLADLRGAWAEIAAA
jgi:flagellar protein FliS